MANESAIVRGFLAKHASVASGVMAARRAGIKTMGSDPGTAIRRALTTRAENTAGTAAAAANAASTAAGAPARAASEAGKGLMMPLHWYKKTQQSPLFQLKRTAAIGAGALGAGAYGLSKITEAPEAKRIDAGAAPVGGYY